MLEAKPSRASTTFTVNNTVEPGNGFAGVEISTAASGNGVYGVAISSASNNVVGGATSASANNIAFNGIGGAGVEISGEDSINNRLLSNSIFSHGDLGIDLRGGTQNARGTTKNDPRDADVGPNGLQNKPGLSSAVTSGGKTTIDGKLSTKPNRNFVVRFFSNPSGTDEGKTFIGQKKVTTTSEVRSPSPSPHPGRWAKARRSQPRARRARRSSRRLEQ